MHSVCHIQSDPLHLSVGSSSYFSLCISCEKMHLLQLHLKNREHLSLRKTFWKDISAKSLTLTLQYMYCFTTWMKPSGSGRWPGSVGAAVCSRTPFTALNISSTVVLLHSYWSSCPVQPAIGDSAGGGAGPHGPRVPYQAQPLCDSMILPPFPQWETLQKKEKFYFNEILCPIKLYWLKVCSSFCALLNCFPVSMLYVSFK